MSLDKNSAARLAKAHPLLQKLFNAVAAKTPIMILDSQRGRAAQELAFRQGHTKVHFGNSAHNWSPSVALDVVPIPLDWKDTAAFRNMIVNFVVPIAKEMNIPMAEVYEVATFYHHFEVVRGNDPVADITLRVCDGIACELAGAQNLLAKLPAILGNPKI